MKQHLLYDEAYNFDIKETLLIKHLHFDYGTRYNQINMQFQHFHPFYEIYVLLTGQAQHTIEGTVYDLDTYDIVLLRPYILHKTNYHENSPCKRLIISFTLDALEQMFPDAIDVYKSYFEQQTPIFRLDESSKEDFVSLFNKMYKLSKNKQSTSDLVIISYFIQLLELISHNQETNLYMDTNTTDRSIDNKIYEITTYIHNHFKEKLSLQSLSEQFYISPHYLSRQFKAVTQFTLIKYIQEVRVKRAQELLLDTDLKITKIIEQCGFGSLSQFNRVFFNVVQCSPSEYRNRNRM